MYWIVVLSMDTYIFYDCTLVIKAKNVEQLKEKISVLVASAYRDRQVEAVFGPFRKEPKGLLENGFSL